MAPTTLEIECRSGIGTVWLNRPEVRNAFDEGMIAELAAAFAAMAADDAVRVVVVGGRGSAFCAGADLNWMKKMAGFSPEENYADALGLAEMLHALAALPKPTVARVHGAAFAGGLGLVAACDIAVAAHEAEFCVSEVKLGLLPATRPPEAGPIAATHDKKPRTPREMAQHARLVQGERSPRALLAQAEFFNQRAIRIRVAALQVVQQLAAAADHAQQAATRVVVLLVGLEVVGQFIDAGREQGNLDFRRTGIAGGALELRNDVGFDDICNRHFIPQWTGGSTEARCREIK